MLINKSYKGRFFTFLFFLVFLIIFNASATTLRISVKVSKANIRLKPNTEAPIISTAPIGSILISNEKIGNWHKVDLPPDKEGIIITGYIHNNIVDVLEEIDEIIEEKSEQLVKYKLIIKEQNAEIRLKPSENSLQIFSPPLGVNLVSFEKINGWYKVSLPPDQQGIVLSGYINISSVEIEEEIKEKPKIEKLEEEKTPEPRIEKSPIQIEERGEAAEVEVQSKPVSIYNGFSLVFPRGDWAELFGAGLGISGGLRYQIISTPPVDVVASAEGILFMRKSGYTEISWTRIIGAVDGRYNLKLTGLAKNNIALFAQAGIGLYWDILNVETFWWYTTGSEIEIGARFGGGIKFGKFEIMALYHLVERKIFSIVGTYTLK